MSTLHRRALLSSGSLAFALLAGCLSDGPADEGDPDDDSSADPAEMSVLSAEIERTEPAVSQADLEALVSGNNAFAFELLAALADEGAPENRFFSPFSISLALAMTWAGARGETETAMAETLSFPHDQETLHPAFNALWRGLESGAEEESDGTETEDGEDEPFTLEIANSIWGQDGYEFEEAFLETLARHYGADLRTLDFENEPEPARAAINDWVAEETEGTIEDLLPEGSIEERTRLVLTNAIYFYANWHNQFDEENTDEGTFTALDGTESQVPMMAQHLDAQYAAVEDCEVLELPYVGDATMVLLVPEAGAFEVVRDGLDADRLDAWLEQTGRASGDLALPRFEFQSSISLKETLSAMGMDVAFTRSADFSGMTAEEDLLIDDVYHDAHVAVDEDGTEASAATGVVMVPTSAPAETFDLTVDRPFFFAIRDDATGSLLFLGQVVDAGAAQ